MLQPLFTFPRIPHRSKALVTSASRLPHLLNVSRACQTCHRYPEEEIKGRAEAIQDRTKALLNRAEDALVQMMDTIQSARGRGLTGKPLEAAQALHRKAQWRLDFVASENSM